MGSALGRDAHTQDPVVCKIWAAIGAVPVIPIQPKLDVYSVLRRERGGFKLLGTLSSLCTPGPHQSELQRIICSRDAEYVSAPVDLGTMSRAVRNDARWLAKVGVSGVGASFEIKNAHTWKVDIPRYYSVAATDEFDKVVKMFSPDSSSPDYRKGMDFWIVREVITAPELVVTAQDDKGGGISFDLPTLALPLPVNVGVESGIAGGHCYRIKGPPEGSGFKSLPIAFRGYQYHYENGLFKRRKATRIHADGHIDQAADDASQPASHSPDMQQLLDLDCFLSIHE